MGFINMNQLSKEKQQELDPIACFIKETKAIKRDAVANGKQHLANYADSVLDFITYAIADCQRLNWLEENPQHLNIKTTSLRDFIDLALARASDKTKEMKS